MSRFAGTLVLVGLNLLDGLDLRVEGSTIAMALDRSAAGLERLEACYARNGSATEADPFKAPAGKP